MNLGAGIGALLVGAAMIALSVAVPAAGVAAISFLTPAALVSTGLAAAVAGAGMALMPSAPKPEVKAPQHTMRTDQLDEWVIYGRARAGAQVAWMRSHGNDKRRLTGIFLIAAHECDGLEAVYINGDYVELELNGDQVPFFPATDYIPVMGSGYRGAAAKALLSIGFYDGTQAVADPYLRAEFPTEFLATHIGRGYCYARPIMRYAEPQFLGGPPDLTFVVRGKKVWDPRNGLTAWSANAALCTADWATTEWARSLPRGALDRDSLITAANICDQPMARKGGGTSPRYEVSIVATCSAPWRATLDKLEQAMGGKLLDDAGKIFTFAAAPVPETFTITEADLVGPLTVVPNESVEALRNIVRAVFLDRSKAWKKAPPVMVSDPEFLAEDHGQRLYDTLELDAVDRSDQAQRLAKIALRESRNRLTVELVVHPRVGMAIMSWDKGWLILPRYGWAAAKRFRCTRWERIPAGSSSGGGCRLTLRESRGDEHVWDASEEDVLTVPALPPIEDPRSQLPVLEGLGVEIVRVIDVTVSGVLMGKISWDTPNLDDAQVDGVELRWRTMQYGFVEEDGPLRLFDDGVNPPYGMALISDYALAKVGSAATTTEVGPLKAGFQYELEARFTWAEYQGPWSTVVVWVMPPAASGDGPWRIEAVNNRAHAVRLTWKRPSDKSVKLFEVYGSRVGGSVANRNAATLVRRDASGTSVQLESLAKGGAWLWMRGRRDDGSLTGWGTPDPVFIDVVKGEGLLAGKDLISTSDIEPSAVTVTASGFKDQKAIDNTASPGVFLLDSRPKIDLPPSSNGVTEYDCDVSWSFVRQDDAASYRADISLTRNGTVIATFAQKKNGEASGTVSLRLVPGSHSFQLFGRVGSGSRVLESIRLVVVARLR